MSPSSLQIKSCFRFSFPPASVFSGGHDLPKMIFSFLVATTTPKTHSGIMMGPYFITMFTSFLALARPGSLEPILHSSIDSDSSTHCCILGILIYLSMDYPSSFANFLNLLQTLLAHFLCYPETGFLSD